MKTVQKSERLTTTLRCAMKTSLMQQQHQHQKLSRFNCDGDCVDHVVWVACSSRSHCFFFSFSCHDIQYEFATEMAVETAQRLYR